MKVVNRKSAVARGLARYFTGKPCLRGHVAQRQTVNGCCLECNRTKQKAHRSTGAYRAKRNAALRKAREDNPLIRLREENARLRNRDKRAEWGARYRQSEKGQVAAREKHLRERYKLTEDGYETMLAAQSGGCAICHTSQPGKRRKRLSVDHCHRAGRIRGLLCNRCNISLGGFDDSPLLLRAAARYLEKSSA